MTDPNLPQRRLERLERLLRHLVPNTRGTRISVEYNTDPANLVRSGPDEKAITAPYFSVRIDCDGLAEILYGHGSVSVAGLFAARKDLLDAIAAVEVVLLVKLRAARERVRAELRAREELVDRAHTLEELLLQELVDRAHAVIEEIDG